MIYHFTAHQTPFWVPEHKQRVYSTWEVEGRVAMHSKKFRYFLFSEKNALDRVLMRVLV